MLERYWASAPIAARVLSDVFMSSNGYGADQVYHDHFAFRTFGVPGMGIESLGPAVEAFGYVKQDYFVFPNKHLLAAWYAPPEGLYEVLPRLFISELQVEKLSKKAQAIIQAAAEEGSTRLPTVHYSSSAQSSSSSSSHSSYSSSGSSKRGNKGGKERHGSVIGAGSGLGHVAAWTAAVTGTLPWGVPEYEDYKTLLEESEYAAWVLAHGYGLNHTALSIHRITPHQGDIYAFANTLVMKGFDMNDEGGIMKVSPDAGLLQCSTVADVVPYTFKDGQVHSVAGAYLEFVERKPLSGTHEGSGLLEVQRRDGFETASADDIFASTTLAMDRREMAAGGSAR